MSKRGLIWRRKGSEGESRYSLVPWMFGIWEFQLNTLTQENIKLYEQFHEEAIVPLRQDSKIAAIRVIPIEKAIQGGTEIQPYEKVSQIIDSNTRFAVAECVCRKEARLAGKGCDKLLEACLTFRPIADFYIENGLGREISKEETRQILLKAEEDGLSHCSANHSDNKTLICNCCVCYCKSVGTLIKHNALSSLAKSNYYAALNGETCIACGTCAARCQVHAIQVENNRTFINRDRGVGCGLCVSTCPTGSIALADRPPDEVSAIFLNQKEMMQA